MSETKAMRAGLGPKTSRGLREGARLLVLALCLAPWLGPAPAGALTTTVLPGDFFEVAFTLDSVEPSARAELDTLTFALGPGTVASGVAGYEIELRDGGSVLGTASTADLGLWIFRSASSLWALNPGDPADVNPVEVDFGSLQDGSFDGAVRLTPIFSDPGGSLEVEFNPPPGTGLRVGKADSESSAVFATIPEPGPMVLLVAGGLALGLAGRCARRG